MDVELKKNKSEIKDLVIKIKDMARKLPQFERNFIIGRLPEVNLHEVKLAYVVDLINEVNNWYWNGKYKDFERRIKSHLFDIHTWLKQLKSFFTNEAKKAEIFKDE